MAAKIRDEHEVDLSPLQYTVPQPLIDVLRRALAKKAATRYPTAAAMEKDLREIVQRRSKSPERPAKPVEPTVPLADAPSVPGPSPTKRVDDRTFVEPALKKPGGTRMEAGPTRRVWDSVVEPPPSRKGWWIAGAAIAATVIGIALWVALRQEGPSPNTGTEIPKPLETPPRSIISPEKKPDPIAAQPRTVEPTPTKPAVETTGALVIDSVPPGAAIEVDKVYRG